MGKKKQLVKLGSKEAIEAIRGTKTVMYCHGVWNPYRKEKTDTVIQAINKSGYGADVFVDEETGVYYVDIPSDGDMF